MMQKQDVVLLTGVTGFLGSHTTIQLLEKGYKADINIIDYEGLISYIIQL